MHSRSVLLLVVFATAAVTTHAAELSPVLQRLKKDIYFLASEECEGRGVETKGILLAGEYIADTFKHAGLKPAMPDGSYFQPFNILGASRLGSPTSLTLHGPKNITLQLDYDKGFTPTAMSASAKVSAKLVFVGFGITSTDPKFDEYAGIDAKGKIVVVMRRAPNYGRKGSPFDPQSPHPSLIGKVENAIAHGAAGVIFVNDATEKGDALMPFGYARGSVSKDIPILQIKRSAATKLFTANGLNLAGREDAMNKELAPQSVELPGWTADAEVTLTRSELPTRNVIAVAEGSGPLANETVVIGAHYDHLGRGEVGSLGGSKAKNLIHYGADDNGSGTTGLLEIARRIGGMKHRTGRRIVFIAFSGEERGLHGSIYYCAHPLFPLDTTCFMINMDMIGRVKEVPDDTALVTLGVTAGGAAGASQPNAIVLRDRLVAYGTGTAEGLNHALTAANATTDFKLIRVPGGTGPSDHDSFYRKHIPVLFFFSGTHPDYHRPSDTADKINLDGLRKTVELAEKLLLHFAATTHEPKFLATTGGWSDPTDDRPPVSRASKAKLGIMPGNYEANDGGLLVEATSPGGAAEKAGVKAQDVIIEIAGKPVKNIDTYMSAMAAQKPNVQIEMKILRNEKKMTLKVTPLP